MVGNPEVIPKISEHCRRKAQASVAALQDIRTRLEKAKESYWVGQAEIQPENCQCQSLTCLKKSEHVIMYRDVPCGPRRPRPTTM
jgi:hypothetical protein